MILPIVEYPDPQLEERSEPITEITDDLRILAADMVETMYDAEGIGLAAPQIGKQIRMVVIDVTGPEHQEGLMTLVNPVLTPLDEADRVISEEGCLSVPMQYRAKVERAEKVRIQATSLDGKPVDFVAEGLLAVCAQHEVDHLDGILFLNHLSHLKRSMYNGRLKKHFKQRLERGPLL